MARFSALLAAAAFLSAALLPAAYASDACAALFGVKTIKPFSAIFNADDGQFSGTPESHYFVSNMNSIIEVPKGKSVCGKIIKGKLLGQDTAIVLTGIGPGIAGLCTLEFVTKCGQYVKDIIYSGTSGWSPQVGGTFPDPPNCANANPNKKITRLGDVCVSPLAVNWNCKQASWTQQAQAYPNQCYRPKEFFGPDAGFLYGQCFFTGAGNTIANLEFSMKVMKAMTAGAKNFPKRSVNVTKWEVEYWDITSNNTGMQYGYKGTDPVTVYGYDTCSEIDSQFFFSGAPWDVTARDYVAQLINLAFNSTKTSKDVIAVSAMEAIGVAEAMEKYHSLTTTKRKIPYTFVRGNSDWLNKPVMKTAPGVWGMENTEFEFPFSIGYAYAIATYSAGIMSFYASRCAALVAAGTLPASTSCTFTVPYP